MHLVGPVAGVRVEVRDGRAGEAPGLPMAAIREILSPSVPPISPVSRE